LIEHLAAVASHPNETDLAEYAKVLGNGSLLQAKAAAMSPTGRSCSARYLRMSRRRGSATALKASEFVAALGMVREYIPIWEYSKGLFLWCLVARVFRGLRLFPRMLWQLRMAT
jgi:hypothetical protein